MVTSYVNYGSLSIKRFSRNINSFMISLKMTRENRLEYLIEVQFACNYIGKLKII